MKTTFRFPAAILGVASAALLFGVSATRADDNTKTSHRRHTTGRNSDGQVLTKDDCGTREVEGGTVGGATGREYRVRTGSHLPEHYNRRAYSTDSRDNVTIYDRNDIRLQNSNNVSDTLRQIPGVSVGRR